MKLCQPDTIIHSENKFFLIIMEILKKKIHQNKKK